MILSVLGVLAAVSGVAVGSLVASFLDPAFAPIEVVAASAIDIPPAPVKEWATATFGTSAKYVVIGTVVAAVTVLAAVAGVVAGRRPYAGGLIAIGIGVIGAIAGLRRPNADLEAVVPSLVAGFFAAAVLIALVKVSRPSTPVNLSSNGPAAAAVSGRRAFLAGSVVVAGSAVVFGIARATSNSASAVASRVASKLPLVSNPLAVLPASVRAPVPGMGPFVTPNDSFYRIDTAVVVPQVVSSEWTLTLDGLVKNSFTINYKELLELPMVERDITIMCVSNPVGGEYIGNARWLGTPLLPLLQEAGVDPVADQLLSTSIDGWTCSTPLDGLSEREPLLVVGMNGEPLPIDHGFPVRMVVPGLYGFISATKWVTRITATTYSDFPAYWTVRGWATDAPVLTGSRIDIPKRDVPAGSQFIAGTAWAMDGGGISSVEVQINGGSWLPANLADEPNAVTWRQWWLPWEVTPGEYQIAVRATNGAGQVQTSERRDSFPSGATGYDTRIITVT